MKIKEIFKERKDFTVDDYLKFCGVEDSNAYIYPKWEIDNWNGYSDIDKALEMFNKHFLPLDSTYIICDADLDGITSTSMLYSYMIDLADNEDWNVEILLHEGKERGLQDENIFQHIIENPKKFQGYFAF